MVSEGTDFENGSEMKSIVMASQRQQQQQFKKTPFHLPPKSPKSLSGKLLFGTTYKPSKSRRRQRGRSKERKAAAKSDLPSSALLSGESLVDEALEDPSPSHFNVVQHADDLSSAADFSMVSSEKLSSTDPLKNVDWNKPPSFHRRARSWDSSYAHEERSKICLEVPAFFRRRKTQCADVAILNNSNDIPEEDNGRISGMKLHETAKAALNAGDFVQALALFETLQDAQQKRFGNNHSSVAAAMHNVGVVRLRMGNYKAGETLLAQAVGIRREVLHGDHLDLAVSLAITLFVLKASISSSLSFVLSQASLGKLGAAQVVLCKFDDAYDNLREAIRIIRKTLGRSHKTMAQILTVLACAYFEVGELLSAQATFEDAVEIYSEIFPTDSDRDGCMLQMTEAMCNVGSIQNKRRKFCEATVTFTRAIDLQRGIMGHDNPRVIASLDNLGYSFSKNKSYNRALSCYKEMLNAQLSCYGTFTPECCQTLKKQILIYEKLKDLNGAFKAAKKVFHKASALPTSDNCMVEIRKICSGLKRRHKALKH